MKPCQIIKTFTSKSGKEIVLRYPTMYDVEVLYSFINELSREDTFITYSGEKINLEHEEKFVKETLNKIEKNNNIMLLAFINKELAGNCSVERDMRGKKRTQHVGNIGITLRKQYRGDGIGKTMLETLLELAKKQLDISLATLNVYEPNIIAKKLYESIGFRQYGKLPGGILYKENYVDEIKMYKILNQVQD